MSIERTRLLCSACKSGHLNLVEGLLELGCRPGVRYKNGKTPLHYASIGGCAEIVQYLITKGCDPNVQDENGRTPLHLASLYGHVKIVRYLVDELNCDWRDTDVQGKTSFHYAVEYGHINIGIFFANHDNGSNTLQSALQEGDFDLVKFIYETARYRFRGDFASLMSAFCYCIHNCSSNSKCAEIVRYFISVQFLHPESKDDNQLAPLHHACQKGSMDIVQYLINERGCNVEIKDENNMTPLHYAAIYGHLQIIQFFLSRTKYVYNPEVRDFNRRTPLHHATIHNHLDIVVFFISKCACNPEHRDKEQRTPLHYASIHGYFRIAHYLATKSGCNPDIRDKYQRTPLHYASRCGHYNIVRLLAFVGCNPELTDEHHRSSLHYASIYGYHDITEFLIIKCRANRVIRDMDQRIPLHHAAICGHLNVIKLLISKSDFPHKSSNIVRTRLAEDVEHQLSKLNTPGSTTRHVTHHVYSIEHDPDTVDIYQETPLHYASQYGHEDIVHYLVDINCDPNARDESQQTPLHYACQHGHIGIVHCLVNDKYRGDLEAKSKDQRTPLHYASQYGHNYIVQYLVNEKGCNSKAKDKGLRTPLHYASKYGHKNVVQYLIEETGCDPNVGDKYLRTPLHYASQKGHKDIVKYLVTQAGCDPRDEDIDQQTSLHLAALHGREDVVQYLIDEHRCYPDDPEGQKIILYNALQLGKCEIPLYLTSLSSVRHYSSDLNTELLLLACEVGNLNLVKSLISRFPEYIMSTGNDQQTALHISCKYGHTEIAQYLIEDHNCDFEATDVFQLTPLNYACLYGHRGIIECINTVGSNSYYDESESDPFLKYSLVSSASNQEDIFQDILYLACKVGHIGLVKLLIDVHKLSPDVCDANQFTPLHYACENGNMNIVSFLLSQPSYHPTGSDKKKLLFEACKSGSLKLVLSIVQIYKFNPDVRDDDRKTPLHYASTYGYYDIVKFFITECACNVDTADKDQRFPLHYACMHGYSDIVKLIANNGDNLEPTDIHQLTPLNYACLNGYIDTANHLDSFLPYYDPFLEYCISVSNLPSWNNQHLLIKVLFLACKIGHIGLVKFIINNYEVSQTITDENHFSLLHCACINWNIEIAQFLLLHHYYLQNEEKGVLLFACQQGCLQLAVVITEFLKCDPNTRDQNSRTPLHHACANGHINIVKYLINNSNALKETKDENGITPLHCATESGHTNIVMYLTREQSCDPRIEDEYLLTSLHYACKQGHIDLVHYLTNFNNQIIDDKDINERSPLHYAAISGHLDVLCYLIIECSCNTEVRDCGGRTPLHYAALSGHKQIVIYLITEQRCNRFCVDSDNWTPLHFACQGGHIEIIEYIISKPESLKEMTKKSQVTLLHCASKYGCIDIMRNLIGENICDLNIGDEHQQTPLHYACMSGNIVSVRFLISEFKCDLNLKDTDQQTPLHFATQYGHIDVVKYLATEKGCDLQAKDKDQQTSLHLAILHGHESIVCYLVNERECFPANNKEDQRILIQYALRLDKYEIPLYLISLSSVRHYSSDLNTELFLLACKVGNLDLVKSLISRFPKCIMSTGKDEETALHISCRYGHREVTQYLIEDHKCDFEATDVFKLTPKHYASLYGHKGIIEYFNTLRVYYNKSDSDPFLTYSLSCSALNQTEFFSDILFLACKVGHLGFVKFIVEVPKWSPDIYDDDQLTPLYHACENGNVEIISFLLSQPSYHPNISDKQKVIFEACKIGALELVLYIVEVHKFNPEVYDDNQKTPLYYACLNGFSHIALYLLEQVHILHSGYLNNDMFFAACRKGLVDVLKRLFTVTALKKVITNASNQTLLHCGCIYGHLDVVSYLISEQNYDLKAVDLNNSTPLDYALQNNHIQIVEYLRGDMKDEYGIVAARYSLTPLYDACLNGCLITVRYFIDIKGYSPEVRDEDGRTPLHCASQNSHCDIVKYLIIEKGCDPDVVDRDNFTALHYICSYEHSADDKKACEVVRFLINSAKCNLKIAAKSGSTPLHFACMYGKRDIIKILLSDGKSDPNVKNNAGKTPYDELCSPLDLDILKEFINHDMNAAITYNNVIVIPKEEDSLEFMKILTYTRSWNPSKQTDDGDSALHIACQANKPKLVNFLLCYTECDPNVKNNCGKTPLYMSPYWWTQRGLIRLFANHGARDAYGLMIVHVSEEEAADFIKKLCLNGKDSWNPNLLDSTGKTLLHYACEANRPRIVHTLLAEGSCNPNIRNCAGLTPVYLNSNPDIIGKLVQYGADLYSVYSVLTQLPEDTALQVFDYLSLNCAAWDPNKKTADGEIALHFACRMNYLKLAHHLLPKAMLMDDPDIIRPVFFHSDALSLEVVKHYSQCHPDWDPNMIYSEGCNMLHLACMANYKMTTHHLLAEKNCNPNTLDQMGNSPLELSSDPAIIKELIQYGANPINVYQHYGKVLGTKQPLQPAVKVFVVGNPSAGKSTLTAALQKELSLLARAFSTNKKVSGVDEKTAGVIPYEFESKKYGRVTLYDFAGQKEFYSSHAALLQNAIKISPPIFLLVVNISDSNEELNQTITYWLSFLKHQCTSVSSRPHVIVVGSHADILISKGEDPNKKCRVVDSICAGPVDFGIEYTGFISMDCQFTESNGMVELRRNLKHSCDALRIQENISFNAHCFQIYLIDKCHGLAAIQIKDIRAKMAENQQSTTSGIMSFIPFSLHSLFNVCKELNDRGHIFFLADSENAENSWIILNKAALLSEVTGTIFAPEGFKQHCQLASSTGVVPLCKLREQFPDLNPRMLVGFLSHLEFCHEINDHEILKLIEEHQAITEVEYSPNEQYFYFPALVRLQTPDNMWIFRPEYSCVFGWIVQCSQPTDFFTPWFHQVLLLRLAFHFALIPSKEETNLQVPSIQRKCTVWKNGIFWGNRHGIEALVEILPDNKDVIFLIRGHECKLLEFMELRSQVLLKVRECVNDFCENILITEGLINRSEVAKYPFSPTSIVVLHMTEILKALLTSSTFIVASNGTSYLIKDLLTFEPYFELREKLLQQLCHEYASKCNKKVTDEFISSLSSCVKKSDVFVKMFDNKLLKQSDEDLSCALYSWINTSGGTYRQFRERLDHFSVFSGRNILEEAGMFNPFTCKEKVPQNNEDIHEGDKPQLHQLQEINTRDGRLVRVIESVAFKWEELAIALGFEGAVIERIKMDAFYKSKNCTMSMFKEWLNAESAGYEPATWTTIIQCLIDSELAEIAKDLESVIVWTEDGITCSVTIPPRGDKPTLQKLQLLKGHNGRRLKVIEEVAPRWEELASALQFDHLVILQVKADYLHREVAACRHIFTMWLEEERDHLRSPVTWETFIQCLTDAEFSHISVELEEILSSQ